MDIVQHLGRPRVVEVFTMRVHLPGRWWWGASGGRGLYYTLLSPKKVGGGGVATKWQNPLLHPLIAQEKVVGHPWWQRLLLHTFIAH